MKKLNILFLFLVLGITITSCSSDNNPQPAPSIEGKWVLSKSQVYDAANQPAPEIEFKSLNGPNDETCTTPNVDYIIFKPVSEAPYNAVYGNYPQIGCDLEEVNINYEKAQDQITILGIGSNPLVFAVVSLTSTELKLKLVYDQGYTVYTLIKG